MPYLHISLSQGQGTRTIHLKNFFGRLWQLILLSRKKFWGGVPGNSFFDQLNFGNSQQFANILAFVGCLLPFSSAVSGHIMYRLMLPKSLFALPKLRRYSFSLDFTSISKKLCLDESTNVVTFALRPRRKCKKLSVFVVFSSVFWGTKEALLTQLSVRYDFF